MTYRIAAHIAEARRKEEWWTVDNLEAIKDAVEAEHPFANDMQTLATLTDMAFMQKKKRDKLEKYTVDFGTEWSKLNTIENVSNCVQRSIHSVGGVGW